MPRKEAPARDRRVTLDGEDCNQEGARSAPGRMARPSSKTPIAAIAAWDAMAKLAYSANTHRGCVYKTSLGILSTYSFWLVASLNISNYGGFNDWTLATGDIDDVANAATNQLAEFFDVGCGNSPGGMTSFSLPGHDCTALGSVINATLLGTGFNGRTPTLAQFYSSTLVSTGAIPEADTRIESMKPGGYFGGGARGSMSWGLDDNFDGSVDHGDPIGYERHRKSTRPPRAPDLHCCWEQWRYCAAERYS
jgi:hypothetical protein